MKSQSDAKLREQILFSEGAQLAGVSSACAIKILCAFARDKSPELRMRVYERMSAYKGREIAMCLMRSLHKEKDVLATIAAMESVGCLKITSAMKILIAKLHHRNPMVRGYAAIVLSERYGAKVLRQLEAILKKERSAWGKAAFYIGMYKAGATYVLPDMLRLLKCRQYRVRSFIVNNLCGIKFNNDIDSVINALRSQVKIEENVVVASAIKRALRCARAIRVRS